MDGFDRRVFLNMGLGGLGAALVPRALVAEDRQKTLAQAGASVGLDIGSAIRPFPRPEVAEIIRRECTLVTPENALKPGAISPAQGYWNFSGAEKTRDFARENGLKMHGHTLFWHQNAADWLERRSAGKSLADVSAIYADYMQEVVAHFPDIVSWDVFNEIIEQDRRLRDTYPISPFGVDFIERCLRAVRAAAPHAKLVINEYNLECAGNWCATKRRNALSVLRELRDRDAPIDAIGIQGHLHSRWKPSAAKTLAFIRSAEEMGLEVYLSEMDVNDVDMPKDIARRDRQVSRYYEDFLGRV
ncbi:MAG TPA: hypothetical protein ENK83_05365, partial [Aliiroseovarius sp.]|nr:hypothetical protein [Aliiroseovarius sp.]